MKTRIVVGEHDQMLCEGIVRILDAQQDMLVVGEAGDGREVVALAKEHRPSVVLMDTSLPVTNGLDATRRIRRASDAPAVVLMSARGGSVATGTAREAGAAAYVDNECTPEAFLETIRTAAGTIGLSERSSASGGRLVRIGIESGGQSDRGVAALTSREREVLQLLSEGYAAKEVGDILGISVKTVSTHRVRICEKLDTRSVAGMTKIALREGLTALT